MLSYILLNCHDISLPDILTSQSFLISVMIVVFGLFPENGSIHQHDVG